MTFVRIEQVDRKEKDKEKDKSNKSEEKETEPKERFKQVRQVPEVR